MGFSEEEARELAEKIEEFVRAMVKIIESGGGGRGGSA